MSIYIWQLLRNSYSQTIVHYSKRTFVLQTAAMLLLLEIANVLEIYVLLVTSLLIILNMKFLEFAISKKSSIFAM